MVESSGAQGRAKGTAEEQFLRPPKRKLRQKGYTEVPKVK